MDHMSHYVLKKIRPLVKGNENEMLSFTTTRGEICVMDDYESSVIFKKYKNELELIVFQLVETGHLVYGSNKYNFFITLKGMHPFMIKWEQLKSFLFRSVFIPVFVSAATSLLIWLFKEWFSFS